MRREAEGRELPGTEGVESRRDLSGLSRREVRRWRALHQTVLQPPLVMSVERTVRPQPQVQQRHGLRGGVLRLEAVEDVWVEEDSVPREDVVQGDGGLVQVRVPQVGEVEAGMARHSGQHVGRDGGEKRP